MNSRHNFFQFHSISKVSGIWDIGGNNKIRQNKNLCVVPVTLPTCTLLFNLNNTNSLS